MMKLYNTLTKQIEEVRPLTAPTVSVYTCGPTVYDYPHIGNWFTFIRYDLLVRTLKASGYQPKWVMNITDVGHLVSDADEGEDKLEKGAHREGKTAGDIANYYSDYFVKGLNRLNFVQPNILPKATDHIQEQINMIELLEHKSYTYIIDDGVYYDTSKFAKYADFAQLDLDEQQAGARVEVNPQKRNPSDFALWKFSPKDHKRDMEWDSPWGKGFPGWHIECSAMSMKYLGDTIDIHSGGIDHIPVHHTNEIAQSEAATGQTLANLWMHTNHIMVNDEKISKSLGNGITLEDIEAKGYSLEAFRLHVFESHYRSQSKFSWDSLKAAQNRLKHYQQLADLRWQIINFDFEKADKLRLNEPIIYPLQNGEIINTAQLIFDAIYDDLSTPRVLAILSEFTSNVLETLVAQDVEDSFIKLLEDIDNLLGLKLLASEDITNEQKQIIKSRVEARTMNNWNESDSLRDKLAEDSIGVRDTQAGTIWFRL